MAGVRFDQNQIRPGVSKCRASATLVKVMETIADGDILVATGYDVDLGVMEVHKATATVIAKAKGTFWVADYAVTVTGTSYVTTAVALEWKLVKASTYITGVLDTSGATAGDAVYLSATAGKLFTIGSYPAATAKGADFSAIVRVGRVVRSHATEGVIMLTPSTTARSEMIVGKVTLGGTSTTVTGFTAELNDAAIVLTTDKSSAMATAPTAVMSNGVLTIHHASSSDDCTYMIVG